VTISGFSKTFSITGWRVGYSVSEATWAAAIGNMNDIVYVCAPAPLQKGIAEGMAALSPAYYEDLCQSYARKRDKLCSALDRAGLPPYRPQGAYYVLADVSSIPGTSSKDKATYLLQKTGIAAVPGDAFFTGSEGTNLCRFCFARPDDILDEAAERLSRLSAA
jgi:aminotransferase